MKRRFYLGIIAGLIIVLGGLVWLGQEVDLSRWNNLSAVVASRLVELANAERSARQLPELKTSASLTAAAEAKAEDMAKRGYFSHEGPAGEQPWTWLVQNNYHYRAAGENLAINFDDSKLLDQAWMDSTTHRANILRSDFQEIGIGIARGRYQGEPAVFVVQFFGTPVLQ